MSAKTLIEIDVRIAVLRAKAAQGKATAATAVQLQELIKKRGELIEKIVADRAWQTAADELLSEHVGSLAQPNPTRPFSPWSPYDNRQRRANSTMASRFSTGN